jgi:hypothetical protein
VTITASQMGTPMAGDGLIQFNGSNGGALLAQDAMAASSVPAHGMTSLVRLQYGGVGPPKPVRPA